MLAMAQLGAGEDEGLQEYATNAMWHNWKLVLLTFAFVYRPSRQVVLVSHPLFAVLPPMVFVRVAVSLCPSALCSQERLLCPTPTRYPSVSVVGEVPGAVAWGACGRHRGGRRGRGRFAC